MRGFLVAEGEQVGRIADWHATHLIGNETYLLGGDARTAQYSFGFHDAISLLLLVGGFLVAGVTLERAGHGELAELVTDHVLVDQNRHMLAAIVDRQSQSNHFRRDHGAARPGLDRTLVAAC